MALKMNKTAIRLLVHVNKGITDARQLRAILGISDPQFGRLVRDLVVQNYLDRGRRRIKAGPGPKYALFGRIARRYDIQTMLRNSNEVVLRNMAEPTTPKGLQNITGLSLRTIQRTLTDFDSIGIIERTAGKIRIRQDDDALLLFAKYLKSETESATVVPGTEVIYRDSLRILQRVEKGRKADGELTGFSLFSDYGIEYHTTFDFYIKQDFMLKIEDVLIHAVVSAVQNKSKNEIAMCILFYLKNKDRMDTMDLRRMAVVYSVASVWLDIEGYTRDSPATNTELFLPKPEFEEKARLYNIPPELYNIPNAHPGLFEEIGSSLATPVDAYLLGGENMRKKGIKPRTKDCDLVVTDDKHRREFLRTLEQMGYDHSNRFKKDDDLADPFDMLEHPAKSRIDLFKTRIAKMMILSDTMMKRATLESFGRLDLYSLCNEDLFLLKAVTRREGDIQDMGLLVQAGNFDWDIVWDELAKQEHDTKVNFSSLVLESMDYLREQAGILPPFYKRLVKRTLDNEIKGVLREKPHPLEGLIEMLEGGDITEKMIRNRIDYLERTKHLKKITKRGKVLVRAMGKINLNVYSRRPVDSSSRMKDYIRTYFEQLRLGPETTGLALEYVDEITGRGYGTGRKPSGLAAAILYVACETKGDHVTRNDLIYVSGITNASFSNLYKSAKSYLRK